MSTSIEKKGSAASPEFSNLLIIGAGVSGIAAAVYYKRKFGDDYVIYDRQQELGGTWWVNTYPGCAVDIPAMFYSFSFEPKYDWSHFYPEQRELLEYANSTATKWGVKQHVRFQTEVVSAEWVEETKRWRVCLRRRHFSEPWAAGNMTEEEKQMMEEGDEFYHECKVLISCIGGLVVPRKCDIPGQENFKGPIFHSARWDHSVSTEEKNVVVVGNGCSAAQIIPKITPHTKSTTQFMRSAQWMMPRPTAPLFGTNENFAKYGKTVFKYIPFTYPITRFLTFLVQESLFIQFKTTKAGERERQNAEKEFLKYMAAATPEKYHEMVIPKFKLGCKRRVLDDGYLANLNSPNMHLTNEKISHLEEHHIVTTAGNRYPADVVVMANGFDVEGGFKSLNLRGRNGETLQEHWKNMGGPAAYDTCVVNGFPNFFMAFGPNSVTGHSSVLMASEAIASYAMKVAGPVFRGEATDVEISKEAEDSFATDIQAELKNTVWSNAVCQSWYINEEGVNHITYPWSQITHLKRTMFPTWKDWKISYTPAGRMWRHVKRIGWFAVGLGVWYVASNEGRRMAVVEAVKGIMG